MGKQRIAAGIFKAKCLRLIDEVAEERREIVVTKRGRPRAKLVPVDDEVPEIFGCMRGSVTILGDLTEPLDEVWEADA
jgi:prevent-host-death family protein